MAFSEIAPGVVSVGLELPESISFLDLGVCVLLAIKTVRGEVRAYELQEPVAGHQPSQYGISPISPPKSRRDAGMHPLN